MAKIRSEKRTKSRKKTVANGAVEPSLPQIQALLQEATSLLQMGNAEQALSTAQKAVQCLSAANDKLAQLPALELVGEIYVELGHLEQARQLFTEAASLDPEAAASEDEGGGADKFLWLAQLCESGGRESIEWFEKGCTVLRREVSAMESTAPQSPEANESLELKRRKLANALCGAAEVYMTDLSWDEDAEDRCEALVTEACMVAPESPEPLQTLASVRISQSKIESAQAALSRSLKMWSYLAPEDPAIPDFPTRISLARLLMEATMEESAFDVLSRLIAEDDTSVEAWYLGGWCLHLISEKQQPHADHLADDSEESIAYIKLLKESRIWLQESLKLYEKIEYEDEPLREHAAELVAELNKTLGVQSNDTAEIDEEEDSDGSDDDDGEGTDMDET